MANSGGVVARPAPSDRGNRMGHHHYRNSLRLGAPEASGAGALAHRNDDCARGPSIGARMALLSPVLRNGVGHRNRRIPEILAVEQVATSPGGSALDFLTGSKIDLSGASPPSRRTTPCGCEVA